MDFDPDPKDSVFDSLFKQYEYVLFNSIITSFGLDAFIKDQHGGDVDTIHNVRQIGKDMQYKNIANASVYESKGKYNYIDYHKHINFRKTKHDARNAYHETGKTVEDAYTGKDLHFLGKSKNADPGINAELDHVISAKSIHDDRGRLLSGLNGEELANSPENLKFTNKSLNSSMGATKLNGEVLEIPEYIDNHPELDNEQKVKMIDAYNEIKSTNDREIYKKYYTSPRFWKGSSIAATKVGMKMGLRQALGFVMTEVWFAVKDALFFAGPSFKEKLKAIGVGIKKGFTRAKKKFKILLSKFGEGVVSGVLSSLTTTLCNIFFTTAKKVVRIIRQTWASIVEATKILIFNPDCLPFSERMQAALKVIVAGASVVLGMAVQEAVHKALMPYIGTIPFLGNELLNIVSTFAGSLCTGFLTVTLLYYIDSNPFDGFVTRAIDNTITEYKRQAKLFAAHAAELQKLDIEKFEQETSVYYSLSMKLEDAQDDNKLNKQLVHSANLIGVSSPWGEKHSLDNFMNNRNTVLQFKV
jgi:hypothetical protein